MTFTLLLWLVIGTLLIVGELVTGTFYLLIFGIAAWVGAGAAYLGHGLDYQLAAAGITALAGLPIVVRYGNRWRRGPGAANPDLDVGNDVRIESVTDASRLTVRYRGSLWNAVTDDGAATVAVGDIAVIREVRGNVLVVQPLPRR